MNRSARELPGAAIVRPVLVAPPMVRLLAVGLLTVGLLAASGCSLLDDDDNSDRITVFVASSLTDVIGDLATEWESVGGSGLVDVVGGSNHLAAQLRDGAPADVFITADAALLDLLTPDRTPIAVLDRFAGNHLVVAVPIDNPAGIRGPADLQRTDTILVACVTGVPCGDASFERYGDLPIDSYEPSVRAVVARLALGEADLGIVYATDVAAEPRIIAAWEEPPACPCVSYAAAALTDRGLEFLDFLETNPARDVLATHGFAREVAPPGSP
ncbi:MAG TPA: molybdate ABC transporter substrate-binding protein [Acidimicrobiia bacterium]|nr:molybdate ABC transporter substrate-binding protein [Acidimicrobiales bacterium]HIE66529.1 molybdate ABC transporter substrate-binding protein [Acidimicrobiia bacterium]